MPQHTKIQTGSRAESQLGPFDALRLHVLPDALQDPGDFLRVQRTLAD
jgi:hypothetical protein